jgi:polyisoprenoid-binding protein YceI
LCCVVGCGLALGASASANERVIDMARSSITIRVAATGPWGAAPARHIIDAPLMDGSFEDSKTLHLQIVIDAGRLRVQTPGLSAADRQTMQVRMLGPDVLDVERFRWISYHSLTVEPRSASSWLVKGELELHGQIHPLTVNIVRTNGRYRGSVMVRQSDFGMTPLTLAGGAVKVHDEMTIDFDIVPAKE